MDHGREFGQNVVHWRREWQTTSAFLPGEGHKQYEKARSYDTGRCPPASGCKVSNILLGKSGGQLLIAPERMIQAKAEMMLLWICLVAKVRSDAVKNNIA